MAAKQNRWLVALFGESLFMDMVETSLQESSELGVVRVDASLDDAGEYLQSLHPDLVVLDLNTPQFQSAVMILRNQPGTPVLCLDANCNQVVTLSSQQHTPATVTDLGRLVRAAVGRATGDARPGRLSGEPLHRAGQISMA
jgi:chemotaxis response regulator CheB